MPFADVATNSQEIQSFIIHANKINRKIMATNFRIYTVIIIFNCKLSNLVAKNYIYFFWLNKIKHKKAKK